MTGSILLDVVIGLVFLYLLYSLFATLIQEIIATQLSFRAKIFEKAIIRMLEDGKSTTCHPWLDRVSALVSLLFGRKQMKADMKVAAAFYSHPLIKYLAEDKWFSKPAYLSAQNFSKVIVDLLRGRNAQPPFYNAAIDTAIGAGVIKDFLNNNEENINKETGTYLKSLWYDAGQDVEKFKAMLEKWYDDTMDRATGWYKKYTQLILFLVGFCIAALFNVDTIQITKNLSSNPKARTQMVQAASAYLQSHKQVPEQVKMPLKDTVQIKQIQQLDSLVNMRLTAKNDTDAALIKSIAELKKTIATHDSVVADTLTATLNTLIVKTIKMNDSDIKAANIVLGLGHEKGECIQLINVLGWLITALAICLGAPFWFDLLNKLMRLRGSGDKIDAPAPTTKK